MTICGFRADKISIFYDGYKIQVEKSMKVDDTFYICTKRIFMDLVLKYFRCHQYRDRQLFYGYNGYNYNRTCDKTYV